MNYFLIRSPGTRELEFVYRTKGWFMGNCVETITQAEFETYKEFGIKAADHVDSTCDSTRIFIK